MTQAKTKFDNEILKLKPKSVFTGIGNFNNEIYTSIEYHIEEIRDKIKRAPEKWYEYVKDLEEPTSEELRTLAIGELNATRRHFAHNMGIDLKDLPQIVELD